jgi:hypothetical protein
VTLTLPSVFRVSGELPPGNTRLSCMDLTAAMSMAGEFVGAQSV